jgi:hypothetical protein
MSTMFVVPAGMVRFVREGLYEELRLVGEALTDFQARPAEQRRQGWQREPLARLDRIRALLDVVGWTVQEPSREVVIDLRENCWALLEALDHETAVCQGQLENARAEGHSKSRRRRLSRRVRKLREFARKAETQALVEGALRVAAGCSPGGPDGSGGRLAVTEREILDLLLGSPSVCWWPVWDIAGRLGDPCAAREALAALHHAGLVSRLGELVAATPAAHRFRELSDL